MRGLVVYESLYGNTEAVATAIAEGMAKHVDVEVATAGEVDDDRLAGVDVLVVGAPTHAWGMPRRSTWDSADDAPERCGPLVREFLADLPPGRGRPAAAFATRIAKPRAVTGSAVGAIGRRLRSRGWARAATPLSCLVTGNAGPLADGELERARWWGDELGRAVDGAHAGRTTGARDG